LPSGSSIVGDLFDQFYVVPTVSTEARYSAGIFGSYVDDFIGVNSYDPETGTFFFLGGFPADTSASPPTGIGATNVITAKDYALSFGFARAFRAFYLGLYYGGSFVYARGTNTGADPDVKNSYSIWRNSLAVLVGTNNWGAFRFDLSLDSDVLKTTSDGNYGTKERWFGTGTTPSVALTWGGLPIARMDPYVTVGYSWPYKHVRGNGDGKETVMTGAYVNLSSVSSGIITMTPQEPATLGLQAGVSYDLDETSSVSGDLLVGGIFGARVKGDYPADDIDVKSGGGFGLGLKGAYSKTLDFGQVSFGFSPNLALGFSVTNFGDMSGKVGSTDYDVDAPSTNLFELVSGVDMGLQFQATRTIALYTGASLQILDWQVMSHSGGDTKDDSGVWGFEGLKWDAGKWAGLSTLGFGMTITPVENLVIGCGLNALLDKLFTIDLVKMQVTAGTFFDTGNFGANNLTGGLFDGLKFDLTVSYKY
jgi:hypothetical protein